MKVVFMGTPDFSVPALDALVQAGHEIACVYTQPPRPAGRGKKDRPTPVHARAQALDLPVRHPTTLRSDEAQTEFAALNADIAVVVAYGLILPQPILDAPAHGCLNIHASLLPRWRGAAPIHRAIMAGDTVTGICIMQMETGLDTGPVLRRDTLPITDTDTTGDLHDRLARMGARLIVESLADPGALTPEPQPENGVTYAEKDRQGGGADRLDQTVRTGRPPHQRPLPLPRSLDGNRRRTPQTPPRPAHRRDRCARNTPRRLPHRLRHRRGRYPRSATAGQTPDEHARPSPWPYPPRETRLIRLSA